MIDEYNKEQSRKKSKLTFRYKEDCDLIISDDEAIVYPLLLTERKKLYNIHVKSRTNHLILKKEDIFFTAIPNITKLIGQINVADCSHLCSTCANFFRCRKVSDPDISLLFTKPHPKADDKSSDKAEVQEQVKSKVTKQDYLESKRIEKYPFIKLGYQSHSQFVVWRCALFKPSPSKSKSKPEKPESEPEKSFWIGMF